MGIAFLPLVISLQAQPLVGDWMLNILDGNRTDYKSVHFFSEKVAYVKGGVTFIYPEDYFSTNPHICITLELKNVVNSPSMEISPLIIKNTAASVSVYVNKTIVGFLKTTASEAETDDVVIHILAFGF